MNKSDACPELEIANGVVIFDRRTRLDATAKYVCNDNYRITPMHAVFRYCIDGHWLETDGDISCERIKICFYLCLMV